MRAATVKRPEGIGVSPARSWCGAKTGYVLVHMGDMEIRVVFVREAFKQVAPPIPARRGTGRGGQRMERYRPLILEGQRLDRITEVNLRGEP